MTLLYLTLAYMLGLLFGRIGWEAGWVGCNFPDWLWWLPLLLLPVTPLLNWLPLRSRQDVALRWPVWAGFEPPRSALTPALGVALFLCSLTGLLRYAGHPLQPCWTPADLAYYNLAADRSFDKSAPEVTVTGYVSSYPLLADTKQQMYVTVAQLIDHKGEHAVHGMLRLTTNIRQIYVYGQPVRLRGRLVTPPDFADFSYREYLARKDVHSLFYTTKLDPLRGPNAGHWWQRALYQVRARGETFINRSLPEPYAGLANGILLGIGAGIDEQLNDKFNLTGTSHVLVISGANVSQSG